MNEGIRKFTPDFYGHTGLAVVLGSGLSVLEGLVEADRGVSYRDVPGLSIPTVEGHPGRLTLCRIDDVPLVLFAGRSHLYEGLSSLETGAIVSIAADLGCQRILFTQAAGSLHRGLPVSAWMLPSDIVSFPSSAFRGMHYSVPSRVGSGSSPCNCERRLISSGFRADVRRAADEADVTVYEGVLCWSPGPVYETPAEAKAALELGADAVTMSALPELVTACRSGLAAACLSLITNHTANVSAGRIDHEYVIRMGEAGAGTLLRILKALLHPASRCEGH